MQRIAWLIQIVVVAGLIVGGFYYWAQSSPARRSGRPSCGGPALG
jgi:hypothetical protein